LISLDFRPEFGGSGYYNNYGSDVALGLVPILILGRKKTLEIVAFYLIIISFRINFDNTKRISNTLRYHAIRRRNAL
jgi:hypothetical protein